MEQWNRSEWSAWQAPKERGKTLQCPAPNKMFDKGGVKRVVGNTCSMAPSQAGATGLVMDCGAY